MTTSCFEPCSKKQRVNLSAFFVAIKITSFCWEVIFFVLGAFFLRLTRITRIKTPILRNNLSCEFHELTNFTNLECSRLRTLSYEFHELTNFTNLECSWFC